MKKNVIYLFLSLYAFCIHGMELNRVILSTNNNPDYIEFWPVVAPLWQKMGIRPTLALIGDENCEVDTSLGDVIRFNPLPNVSQAMQAQTARLLIPALFPDDVCIISDIDMIPISYSYFHEGAAKCPENAFLIYRDKAYSPNDKKYPMCYFAAKGSLFQSIFGVSTAEEIDPKIIEWSKLGYGWGTDETILYSYVNYWEKIGGKVKRLGHGVGPRLDRSAWTNDFSNINFGTYIDCHCPRPYSLYKDSIDQVVKNVNLLLYRRKKNNS